MRVFNILCHFSKLDKRKWHLSQEFDFEKALKLLKNDQPLTGKDGILTPLIKHLTETTLSAEFKFSFNQ
jgi:hypothetical protein